MQEVLLFFHKKNALKNVCGTEKQCEIMSQMQIAISSVTEEHYKNNSKISPPLTGYREKERLKHKEESV